SRETTTTRSKAMAAKQKTLADILSATKPIEKVVRLCVRGDLFAKYEQLVDELERLHDDVLYSGRTSDVADDPEVVAKAREVEKVQQEMERHTYEFRFQTLPGNEWDALVDEHPPRKGVKSDQNAGVNLSTFPKAAVRASCVDPDMSNDDEFEEFWAKLNTGQRNLLYVDGARSVNFAGTSVPKSAIASDVISSSRRKSGSA